MTQWLAQQQTRGAGAVFKTYKKNQALDQFILAQTAIN
ncbi:hypothetical protein MIZ03_1173 [Rhodoferax lithotrophicus]|uniref:Uncharacterized protein n=1 Tax=Rhodoferax lithotrophicus TaxID=2798804 RepID=A0ABM7MJ99_9BURK|nr:hypothetical protein MIZ03_1173 [Rhodoferax sp. MIZ03]